MWYDIFDYTENVLYWKKLIEDVLYSIGECGLDNNKNVIFSPKEYEGFNGDTLAVFRFKKSNSIDMVMMIIDDLLRIDIEGLTEFMEFSIEDVRNNEQNFKEELLKWFTSKIIIKYYCKDYIKIILFDSNDKEIQEYRYNNGLLLIFYYWLCKPEVRKFEPLF